MAAVDALGDMLAEEDTRLCRDISEAHCKDQPGNALRMTLAQSAASIGDALADPKVVMPWLMGVVGAPAFLTSMIVPIRESLALLPQILIGASIRRFAVRKRFWIWASVVEGLAVLAMAAVALSSLEGTEAGWPVIGAVVVFSLARSVASIAWKDVLGKTVAKGRRGRVGGHAAAVSGAVAAGVGLYLGLAPEAARPEWLLYALLAAAAAGWGVGALTLTRLQEHPGATEGGRSLSDIAMSQIRLILGDAELRRFLLARALMISTALSSPIYVALAQRSGGGALANLGWLMLATGAAGAVSSSFWGLMSDRSSRAVMALGALISALVGLAALAGLHFEPDLMQGVAPFGAALFVLGVGHAGVRIGRKTQIVDIAGPESKSEYVAVSNTIIGVLLLGVGAAVGALAAFSLEAALLALSVLALAGAGVAFTLRNAQAA